MPRTPPTLDDLSRDDTMLRFVLDSIFDGVYIVDRDRRIIAWNRGAEQITGHTAADVTGRRCADNVLNHIDANGRPLCGGACPLEQCMKTGESVSAKVYPLHKSGRRFPVETHIAPLRNADGEIIAGIEVFRDVSTEEAFRLLQEKFKRIVQRYVSKSTYEEMMSQAASGAAAAARPRDLSVLYLDVVGFTGLSERHSSEQVFEILNSLFGMCDVLTRECHGDIDKFVGDSVMALFIDANDAVEAGVGILEGALAEFNRQRAQRGEEPINVRLGVNSGTVLQGEIGTTDRRDRTVIGDVVNTAKRIESACPHNSLAVSESTLARLTEENAARFVSLGEVEVKGKSAPVPVFTLRPQA